jgi:hypothetical protein
MYCGQLAGANSLGGLDNSSALWRWNKIKHRARTSLYASHSNTMHMMHDTHLQYIHYTTSYCQTLLSTTCSHKRWELSVCGTPLRPRAAPIGCQWTILKSWGPSLKRSKANRWDGLIGLLESGTCYISTDCHIAIPASMYICPAGLLTHSYIY